MASVRRDFFLDPTYRLTEQERALMTAMLHDLVGTVAGDVLAAMPGNGVKAPDSAILALQLSSSGLLDREELVSLLLRRADEHRIATAFAGRAGPRKLPLLPSLVGDHAAAVAAAAMTLIVSRGRRRDAFGQPRIEPSDLPPREAASLTFAVAAALADQAGADRGDLAAAANSVAARDMAEASLDSAVAALAEALEAAGRNDDEMIEATAEDGEANLLANLLAGRAAVLPDTAWGYLVGGQEGGLALIARMAALSRATAARLFAEFGALSGASVEEEIARFDSLDVAEVSAAHQWWQLPAPFRWASDALGQPNG